MRLLTMFIALIDFIFSPLVWFASFYRIGAIGTSSIKSVHPGTPVNPTTDVSQMVDFMGISVIQSGRFVLAAAVIFFAVTRTQSEPQLGVTCRVGLALTALDMVWRTYNGQPFGTLLLAAALSSWQLTGLIYAKRRRRRFTF